MENFSKVLRQLPEGVVRWLLQDCMVNGIPTKFKGGTTNIDYNKTSFNLKISKEHSHLYLEDILLSIYDLEKDEPICTPTEWQDPTPEQVKAIYEGVEKVKGLISGCANHVLCLKNVEPMGDCICDSYCLILFQKSKGFALPISWKEEEERNVDCIQQTGRVSRCETPDPIKDLKERVTKLEQKKQPVKEFKVGDKVIVNEVVCFHFDPNHLGVITNIKTSDILYEIDGIAWIEADEIQHAPKEVESGDGEFRVDSAYIGHLGLVVVCIGNGYTKDDFKGVVIKKQGLYRLGEVDIFPKSHFTPYTLPNKGEIV